MQHLKDDAHIKTTYYFLLETKIIRNSFYGELARLPMPERTEYLDDRRIEITNADSLKTAVEALAKLTGVTHEELFWQEIKEVDGSDIDGLMKLYNRFGKEFVTEVDFKREGFRGMLWLI